MSASVARDPSRADIVAVGIIKMLEDRGTGGYIGESISQLEHCLQCAHYAVKAESQDEIVIAALLHDIGQFLPLEHKQNFDMSVEGLSVGRVGHEKLGEKYLRSLGFSELVYRLVGSHVQAKRYLTAIDLLYYDSLSGASKKSLAFQGGPFQGQELEAFRNDPLRGNMVQLRKWDDMSKVVGIVEETPRAITYKAIIQKHLER